VTQQKLQQDIWHQDTRVLRLWCWGRSRWNYAKSCSTRKLESLCYQAALFAWWRL